MKINNALIAANTITSADSANANAANVAANTVPAKYNEDKIAISKD